MVSHDAWLSAVHPHPAELRTLKVPVPPAAGSVADVDGSVTAQPSPWLSVKVRPAMVSVPDRAGPLVAAAVKLTLPLPLPPAPEVTVIQDALLAAVQAQPAPAETATVVSPPDAGTVRVSGEIAYVQPWPCTTVTVRPAMASVPDRDGPVVEATVNVTVPDPLPLAPDAIAIHDALLVAFHVQPAPAVTATLPLPPAAGTLCVSGDVVNVQPCPCTTVTVCPPTMRVPVRDGPVVAATAKVTLPAPAPLAPAVIVIHGALLAAVQAHPAAALTSIVRLPPPAATAWLSGDTSKPQPGDCVTVNGCPAIVTVPIRDGPVVAATVNGTAPLPVPAVVPSAIQLTSLDAVQGHPAAAVTATAFDPPAAPAAYVDGAIV
jgi:hypothetical protein